MATFEKFGAEIDQNEHGWKYFLIGVLMLFLFGVVCGYDCGKEAGLRTVRARAEEARQTREDLARLRTETIRKARADSVRAENQAREDSIKAVVVAEQAKQDSIRTTRRAKARTDSIRTAKRREEARQDSILTVQTRDIRPPAAIVSNDVDIAALEYEIEVFAIDWCHNAVIMRSKILEYVTFNEAMNAIKTDPASILADSLAMRSMLEVVKDIESFDDRMEIYKFGREKCIKAGLEGLESMGF